MTDKDTEHELQFNDGGADWCKLCGTFDIYLAETECVPSPDPWWSQGESE